MKITFKYKRLIYIVENNISEHNKYRLLDILNRFRRNIFFIRMSSQNEVYPNVTINLGRTYARMVLGEILEYSCVAESPIQCGVSHLPRWNEPL